jgi:tetrahydromethanopterin S-methyltransferase subunit G
MSNDDVQAIHQRLDRLDDKLNDLFGTLAQQVAVCSPSRARLEAVSQTLYGNGREGLVTRVDRLETMRRFGGQVMAALVGLLSGLSVSLFTWLLGR